MQQVQSKMVRDPARATRKPPGWWKVTDANGNFAYYQFRADGRARMLRSAWWDWTYVRGEWKSMADNERWLRWANADGRPTAVFGEPGFIEAVKAHRRSWGP